MGGIFVHNYPHDVHAVWAKELGYKEFIHDGIEEYRVKYLHRFLKSLVTLSKIITNKGPILFEGAPQILTGALWKTFHKKRMASIIVSDPKFQDMNNMKGFLKKFYIWSLNKYDLFICTSHLMKDNIEQFLRNYPEAKNKIIIAYPYADVNKYLRINGNLNNFNISYAGRISKEKGADLTIEAFNLLREKYPKSKLFMMGHGDKKDITYIKTLIKGGVELVGKVDDVGQHFKESSIYLALARSDAANISVIEAMCAGLVPIISKNTGFYRIVEKEINKELVVKDPKEASKIITKLWENKKLLQKYSKICREVGQKYNEKNRVSILVKDYNKFNRHTVSLPA